MEEIHNSTHHPTNIGEYVGDYEILGLIGKGRFSKVWKAKKDDKEVAIKIYRRGSSRLRNFRDEVMIFNMIGKCNNIVKMYDFGTTHYIDDLFRPKIHSYIVMEIADESLSKLIKKYKTDTGLGMAVLDSIRLFIKVFKGLSYLHTMNIAHTDIKPENILLQYDSSHIMTGVLIADLGSACSVDEESFGSGTVTYVPPEIILDEPISVAVDIWATSASLFETITGDLLFDIYEDCGVIYGGGVDGQSIPIDNDVDEESSVDTLDDDDYYRINYRHLLLIDRLFGPPSTTFMDKASEYYDKHLGLKNNLDIEYSNPAELLTSNYEDLSYATCFEISKYLIYSMTYDPTIRPNATACIRSLNDMYDTLTKIID